MSFAAWKLLAIIALVALWTILLAPIAHAAPFLVSDPDPTGAADKCVYQRGTGSPVETDVVVTPPALTGGCRVDLTAMPVGQSNLQVWFKSSVWGVESAKVPFVFAKPVAGGPGPTNLKIVP